MSRKSSSQSFNLLFRFVQMFGTAKPTGANFFYVSVLFKCLARPNLGVQTSPVSRRFGPTKRQIPVLNTGQCCILNYQKSHIVNHAGFIMCLARPNLRVQTSSVSCRFGPTKRQIPVLYERQSHIQKHKTISRTI